MPRKTPNKKQKTTTPEPPPQTQQPPQPQPPDPIETKTPTFPPTALLQLLQLNVLQQYFPENHRPLQQLQLISMVSKALHKATPEIFRNAISMGLAQTTLFRHSFCMQKLGISKARLKKHPYTADICRGGFGKYEAHSITGRDLAALFRIEYNAVSAEDYMAIKKKSDTRKAKARTAAANAKIAAAREKEAKEAQRKQVYESRIKPFRDILLNIHEIPTENCNGQAYRDFIDKYVEHTKYSPEYLDYYGYDHDFDDKPDRTHVPTDSTEYLEEANRVAQSIAFRVFLHAHTDYNKQVKNRMSYPGFHADLRRKYESALDRCNFAPGPPWPWAKQNEEHVNKPRTRLRDLEDRKVDFGGGTIPHARAPNTKKTTPPAPAPPAATPAGTPPHLQRTPAQETV